MSVRIVVDTAQIATLANALAAAGPPAHDAVRRALNHEGPKARTAIRRALVGQTGLKRGTINRAIKSRNANFGALVFVIYSQGGDISLKYFGPRETRRGVTAAPWNKRRLYPGTFKRGGRFPKRVALPKLNGHVFQRAGAAKLPIFKVKSGLFIPEEMVQGASEAAFFGSADALAGRIAHELYRILPG